MSGFKFGVELNLKGVRVEAGYNDRVIGTQVDQTLLQEKDIDAAKRQVNIVKSKVSDTWTNARKKLADVRGKAKPAIVPA